MQDGKNLVLAIVLCLLVVVGWSYLGQKMGWAPQPAAPEQVQQAESQQPQAAQPQPAAPAPLPVFKESEGRDMVVKTPLYTAKLHTGGATLRSFELTNFRTQVAEDSPLVNMVDPTTASMAPMGLLVNGQPSWSVGAWSCEEQGDVEVAAGEKRTVRFVGMVSGMRVVRDLTFDASTYLISEKVAVTPAGTDAVSLRLGYTTGADASNAQGGQYDAMRVGWDDNGSLSEESSSDKLATGVMSSGTIYWGGAMSTYFFNGVLPGNPQNVTFKGVLQNGVYRVAMELAPVTIAPGQESVFTSSYWMGPKERKLMAASSEELAKSVDLGMFSIIAKALLWILDFFYGYVGNWGIAIILLTIVIKAIFWPLTAKSYSSMEKMKKLAPMMQKIKEKHKGDKEAMNKEVMALYKTYGVNPASGCMPILIQMPVFFGLYQALLTSIELRHASFISTLPFTDIPWLCDLSARDPLYITPIVMGLSMLIQQKLAPQGVDPKQQKIMMILPIVFTFLFLAFPCGLVVYWLVNNIISIGQQWMMHRKMKTPGKPSKGADKPAKGAEKKAAAA
ncbi:MAG: membrane protein insertase YidC [Desulfovibrionaceae bacterium]|nr:membrane protein insertase YidC [Desulfovibrionaceae bacterium]